MAYDRRSLTGIGGWLAFFIITLGLNALASLLLAAMAAVALFGGATAPLGGSAYAVVLLLLALVRTGGYAFLVWLMNWRQVDTTPRRVIIGLWVLALGLACIDVTAALLLTEVDARSLGYALGVDLVRPLIYAALWTAYLLRSERVANTYTADDPDRQLAVVFE